MKKEAARAIANVTSGNDSIDQIKYLVEQGCIPPLCTLLNVEDDAKVITLALKGLENIIKTGKTLTDQNNGINPYVLLIEKVNAIHMNETTRDTGQTSLLIALEKGYLEIANILLKQDSIDVNQSITDNGQTPFSITF